MGEEQQEETLPLTSLCAICHVNPLKYTCPRCSIHTCSLPCVKLHKKRAQCSGIRNPAEYVRRAELATPAGFDRDFNFLTGLERSLKRAEKEILEEKRIDLIRPAGAGGGRAKPVAAAVATTNLEKAAEERGVSLIRAPVGLSRRNQNKSRVVVEKRNTNDSDNNNTESVLMWTIEWISWNGKRRVQNFDERKTLAEAYAMCHPTSTAGTKKRKREEEKKERELNDKSERPPPDENKEESTSNSTTQSMSINTAAAATTTTDNNKNNNDTPEIPENIHLYLHRPQTSCKIKCLIPLLSPATTTIRDMLRDKKVVEFPTIYVRNEPPSESELPPPFILDSRYLEEYGEDIVPAQSQIQAQAQAQAQALGQVEVQNSALNDFPILKSTHSQRTTTTTTTTATAATETTT